MRTLQEITAIIKQAFVSNDVLIDAYGLDPEKTFDEQFSSVSVEAAFIGVAAYAWHIVEMLLSSFRKEIEERIANAYIGSFAWWHAKVMEFQLGHPLEFNATTYTFGYQTVDENARVVKFAAVRQVEDDVTKLQIFTNKDGKLPLSVEEHKPFKAYVKRIGPAGLHYEFINALPDELQITVQVIFDPLILNDSGAKLDGGSYPVREAINAYVDGIIFGGTLNITKLIDAIQASEGVIDVVLNEVNHRENGGEFELVEGQNVESASGSFIIETLTDSYTPDV